MDGFANASTSAFDPVGTAEPDYPKSLYLIQPLFSVYELHPVAPEAQASVAPPEGLDLDAWIVPLAKPVIHEPVAQEQKKKKKVRKEKGKEKDSGDGSSLVKKTRKKAKTQEEIAEEEARAQVCQKNNICFNLKSYVFFFIDYHRLKPGGWRCFVMIPIILSTPYHRVVLIMMWNLFL